MLNYEAMAKEFCEKTGTEITINYKEKKLNPWNAEDYRKNWKHDIYRVTIKRNGEKYSFDFTQSKNGTDNGEKPTEYDILACLQKYEVGTFEDFCAEFGYELYNETYTGYNRKSERTYNAVVKEYNNVMRLFGDVIDELAEIN